MAGDVYLPDTSVWVLREHSADVKRRCNDLQIAGRLATCQMTALEYLNNASNPKTYETLWNAFTKHRWLDVTAETMDRAMDVHRELGKQSQHRKFSLPDLIVAATAELNRATVLHYDSDYDRIAAVTGQPTEWVAPKGSI